MKIPSLKKIFNVVSESINDRNALVDALKKGDIKAAKDSFTSMMRTKRSTFTVAQELGLKDSEYRDLSAALQADDIEKAKEVVGIKDMPLGGPFAKFMEPKEKLPAKGSTSLSDFDDDPNSL